MSQRLTLRITLAAARDLESIKTYLSKRSPSGQANVAASIKASMTALANGDIRGRQSVHDDVRELIEPKYKYTMPYFVEGEIAYILRVYHPRRRP